MLEVQKKVDGLFSFFHDEIEQEVHVNFNIERCKVFSVFQRLGKKESRFNLSTCIDFGKSIMEAVASSDGPCSLVFCSQKLFSNNEFIVAISNDDLCPIRISSITRWYPPKSAIHLKGSVIFKALPFSGDVFDKSFFDYQTSTSFMNRLLTLRLDTFKHLSYFILEGILKTRPLISANIFYNKHQHAINKSNILMEYQWKGLSTTALFTYPSKSAYISLSYLTKNKNEFGILLGNERVKNVNELVAKVAASFEIDDSSKLHIVLGTNKLVSASFDVNYSNFLKMKFSASHVFTSGKSYLNGFGLNMSFDFK